MAEITAQTLAADCGGAWRVLPGVAVRGFAIDSRSVKRGEMFVALHTGRRDGHDFLGDAAARGAAGALVVRAVPGVTLPQLVVADPLAALHALAQAHRTRFTGPVVAVTGSAGKTSTKDLLATLLGDPAAVLATEGNLNNHLGVPLTLLRLDPKRHRFAVVEAGISAPGEMDGIAPLIAPDAAIITTVAPAHLDGLGSLAGVAREKARLAAQLRPGGAAFFPAACLAFPEFLAIDRPRFVTLPVGAAAPNLPGDVHAVPFAVQHEGGATQLCVTWDGRVEEFELRRVTAGMAANAALALTVARHLGVRAETLRKRLPQWRPAALRGEVVREGGRTLYLDCYNANPASMADALESFVGLTPADAPRLFIVGCMEELGTESAALHRATGERWPLRPGDTLLVFGTQAEELAAGARAVTSDADIRVNPERADAVRLVREFSGAVFLKGSRRYELETLLATTAAPAAHRKEVAA